MPDSVVIHTNEVALKKGNRGRFEKRLLKTVMERIADEGTFTSTRRQNGLFIFHDGALSEEQMKNLAVILEKIFGIATFSFATRVESDIDAIKDTAVAMVPQGAVFRVTTKRSDKRFPLTSQEVSRQVGGSILSAVEGTKVDLHHPELVVIVEIGDRGTFVSAGKRRGAGGLPTGTAGTVVSLLSGGIDSPVASWKIMKRGCEVVFVHFHSYPHVGRESIEKVRRLARVLTAYQGDTTIYMVPFAGIQRAIVARCDARLMVPLYRRSMLRIAVRIAEKHGALALVTGDSVGQVASQTLENIRTVSDAVTLPIFRPLIGDDKLEIIDDAQRIGTYAIAIEPHDDCCSLFIPSNPKTKTTPRDALFQEKRYDYEKLEHEAVEKSEIEELRL